MKILGIETSCDETAIGIVEDGRRLLSNAVSSSLSLHGPFGGVIPEIAARAHVEAVWAVLAQACDEARVRPEELDAIAVTQGPGLPGALLIGLSFAKGLAVRLDRPLIAVDHLAAHLYAAQMTDTGLEVPYVGLVVSGGHTILCVAHEECRFERLGDTKDDAVGEAFDKVARLLGLGYPGGPVIDRLAHEGQAAGVRLPRVHTKGTFDFSFSGLKTAVANHIQSIVHSPQSVAPNTQKGLEGSRVVDRRLDSSIVMQSASHHSPLTTHHSRSLGQQQIADIAASFQEVAVEMLVSKTLKACQRTGLRRVAVGGGVACNSRLRARFSEVATAHQLQVVFPPPSLCVDNGAMVAGVGYALLQQGRVAPLSLTADPNVCLN
jgi:N6-L-threonylcarbamoyladenine synthase